MSTISFEKLCELSNVKREFLGLKKKILSLLHQTRN